MWFGNHDGRQGIRDKLIAIAPREFDIESLRKLADDIKPSSFVITSGGKFTVVDGNAPLEERIPESCTRLDMHWHSWTGSYLGMATFLYERKKYRVWFTHYH